MKLRLSAIALVAFVLSSAALRAEVAPAVAPSAPPAEPPADPVEARLRALEARLARAEERAAAPPLASPYTLSAYVQAQLERHQDSEDQLAQGGAPLNQDRFLVRRARLRLDGAWQWAALAVELDGTSARGGAVTLRRADATLLLRSDDGAAPPLVALTAGLTEIPFGQELAESHRRRPFMERTTASLALFPGEPDVGARVWGGYSFFRYAIGVYNGEPLDDGRAARFPRDPNAAKDLVTRFGIDVPATDDLRVVFGTSFLRGKGFHAGTDATKNAAQWHDANENAAIDPGEVGAVPGQAATPSANFDRWGVGADLSVSFRSRLGWGRVYGEAVAATNLDRGLVIADPVLTGIDQREVAYFVGFTQEITPYAVVGFRADHYDPNADFFVKRAGKLLPASQRIRTYSPIVGLVLPGHAKLLFQYDVIRDKLARDDRGVPTDLANDRWTLRLQVEL